MHDAGGVGIPAALTQPVPEDLRREIDRCRGMTEKHFGVNLTVLPPSLSAAYRRIIIGSGITVVAETHIVAREVTGGKILVDARR